MHTFHECSFAHSCHHISSDIFLHNETASNRMQLISFYHITVYIFFVSFLLTVFIHPHFFLPFFIFCKRLSHTCMDLSSVDDNYGEVDVTVHFFFFSRLGCIFVHLTTFKSSHGPKRFLILITSRATFLNHIQKLAAKKKSSIHCSELSQSLKT